VSASNDDGQNHDREKSPAMSDTDTLIAEPDEETFPVEHPTGNEKHIEANENTPLLTTHSDEFETEEHMGARSSTWHSIPRRIASGFINSLRLVLHAIVAPGIYLISWFYDAEGNFILNRLFGRRRKSGYEEPPSEKTPVLRVPSGSSKRTRTPLVFTSGSSSSGLSSESESETHASKTGGTTGNKGASSRHARSKSLQDSEEIAPARRSIRIKLHSEDSMRQRKHKKSQSASPRSGDGSLAPGDISAQLKSPTSPVGALTKYPRTPAPPRPLIPRRQPSYLNLPEATDPKHQKTLILDLDETLIHSMSKGGRMSTGHMVEVRLNTTYVGVGGQASIGPQHPILYYVHKRPFCDDFLRRVSKWYNLVVFTASVQEYADPVIDWLESERKYFSARYYRQHCTFRHGAFIKDLSSVEPDLSKVMILDNSPLSYMFHQDNAIPIQGWINDPTDNDLLYLVPLLEGLQYVSDVRALLALRGGEDGQHMA
jgi:CTD nuclear envelope phosphatase 1